MLTNSPTDIFEKLQSVLESTRYQRLKLGVDNNYFFYPRKLDEHQLHLLKFLLTRIPKVRMYLYLCQVIIWVPLYFVGNGLKYLAHSFQGFSLRKTQESGVPLILISHGILKGKSIGEDSFLKSILKEFSLETKYRVLLIPHFTRFNQSTSSNLPENYENIQRHLSRRQIWIVLTKNLADSLKLCIMAVTASNLEPFSRAYLARAARSQLSSGSITINQLAINLCSRIEKLSSRKVIIPYEGHALEIALMRQIQQKLPKVQIVLFQHAPIVPSQLSFFDGLQLLREKDNLVVTGKIVEKIVLQNRPELKNRIRVLGSDKNIKSLSGVDSKYKEELSVLITPEASAEAISDMYESLKILGPKMNFDTLTFRIHPRYEGKQLLIFGAFSESKFRISDSKLLDDLGQHSICLYRSSAVVFQAMSVGLIPIYCSKIPSALLDPLQLVKSTFSEEITNWLDIDTKSDNFLDWIRNSPSGLGEILTKTGTDYFSPLSKECIKWIESA